MKRGIAVAYLAAIALHLGFVMAHEPFTFDAWNVAADTRGQPITAHRFLAYVRYEYAHANPRIGQALTYLAYKVEGFAEVATPVAYLALTLAITTLGLGRWPRRGRELALWVIATGFGWFAFPQLGRNMFCRAYGANYLYGAAIQLWFLVRLQRGVTRDEAGVLPCVELALFGAVAGLCNEHTGPTLIAFVAAYAWWLRRARRPFRFALAGALGAALGFAAILFAPGQAERYGGLARRAGLVGRVLDRGIAGNLHLLGDYLRAAAPELALVAVVAIAMAALAGDEPAPERRAARRRAATVLGLALLAGLAITATLAASPKQGSRFFLAPTALLLAGVIALLDAWAGARPRLLAPFVALAVVASGYAAWRTIPLFARVADQSAARLAALEDGAPGSTVEVHALAQIGESWWFIGDDFRNLRNRQLAARYLGLGDIVWRGRHARMRGHARSRAPR